MNAKDLLNKFQELAKVEDWQTFQMFDDAYYNELFIPLGDYEVVDETDDFEDDKRRSERTVVHFKDHNVFIAEERYFIWGEHIDSAYFVTQPKEVKKIIFETSEQL